MEKRALVTVAAAALNEGAILKRHLQILIDYMESLEGEYAWEMILIDDGSSDETGALADAFAKERENLFVLHHVKNEGLGKSLQEAFSLSRGDYVVTLDIDLSAPPECIDRLLSKMRETEAKIVIASPTMKGGKMVRVPWHRKLLSRAANRFLSLFAPGKISNFTSMARAYEGPFIRSLNFRSKGMEIMPEILSKAILMGEKIEQIPIRLDWSLQREPSLNRRSSMKILSHTAATLVTGFMLRPFLFFILPGLLILLFSIYPNVWMGIHFFREYAAAGGEGFSERSSRALAEAFRLHPHTLLVGILSLLLSIQLIALGLLSLQSKRYFEEMFHLATKIYQNMEREKKR